MQRAEVGAREARRDRLGWLRVCRDGRGRDGDQAYAVRRDDLSLRRDPIGVKDEMGDVDWVGLRPEVRPEDVLCVLDGGPVETGVGLRGGVEGGDHIEVPGCEAAGEDAAGGREGPGSDGRWRDVEHGGEGGSRAGGAGAGERLCTGPLADGGVMARTAAAGEGERDGDHGERGGPTDAHDLQSATPRPGLHGVVPGALGFLSLAAGTTVASDRPVWPSDPPT